MKHMDLIQAASLYARREHHGQRLKFEDGVYFYEHVKPVAARGWSDEEKTLGLLHDVVEKCVKNELGRSPDFAREESLIHETLQDIASYFRHCRNDITPQSPLIRDLNVITKRISDTGYNGYMRYITRIAAYAHATGRMGVVVIKKSDLDNNSRPDRNPSPNVQTSADKERLRRYRDARDYLTKEFPDVEPRARREDRWDPRQRRGRPPYKRMTRAAVLALAYK